MKKPKMKETAFVPKTLSKAAVMPREAKNMLIEQYQRAQNGVKSADKSDESATEYAQNSIEATAHNTVSRGAAMLKDDFKRINERTHYIKERTAADGGANGPESAERGASGANTLRKNGDLGGSRPDAGRPRSPSRGMESEGGRAPFEQSASGDLQPGRPATRTDRTAYEAGRNLQIGRYTEQKRNTAREAGRDMPRQNLDDQTDRTPQNTGNDLHTGCNIKQASRTPHDAGRDLQAGRYAERMSQTARESGYDYQPKQTLLTGRRADQPQEAAREAGRSLHAGRHGCGALPY